MPKTLIQPRTLFFQFQRTSEEDRVVEGYCFVNEDVGSGLVWDRAAMEAATEDYMRWANIREMHQPSAVGNALSIVWDEKGAYLRAKIEDDEAWNKVKTGVYKGFSARIKPKTMRSNRVTACTWFENSLVDRPADTDCPFIAVRGEGTEVDAEIAILEATSDEVEELRRAEFAEAMAKCEKRILTSAAIDTLSSVLYDSLLWTESTPEQRLTTLTGALQEFHAYVSPLMARGEQFIQLDESAVSRAEHISVLAQLNTTISTLQTERDAKANELQRLEGESAQLAKEVAELRAKPAPSKAVRIPALFQRQFADNEAHDQVAEKRLAELESMTPEQLTALTQEQRNALVVEASRLKAQLA